MGDPRFEGAVIPGRGDAPGGAAGESGPTIWLLLAPALGVVAGLFGGGLFQGVLQALGYLPSAGFTSITLDHFCNVLTDPDFPGSLLLTFHISAVSTLIAGVLGIAAALCLVSLSQRSRAVHFLFQVPLVVPHLVIAVAVVFLLTPAGFLSRILFALGIIDAPARFPLLVNDRWSVGIITAYVWKEIPFITLMLLAVLKNTTAELLEVGRTLKAGPWQRFRFITLPTILPNLAGAGLFVFAYTFGAFEVPYLLGRTFPMALPVRAYKQYSDVDLMARPEGIATGVIIAGTVCLCAAAAQTLILLSRRRGGGP